MPPQPVHSLTPAPWSTLDEPRDLRAEDAFDTVALHAWLSAQVDGLGDPPLVRQFGGGASNLTYLLQYADRDLVLRRPPLRYVRGHTTNPAFQHHGHFTTYLESRCSALVGGR